MSSALKILLVGQLEPTENGAAYSVAFQKLGHSVAEVSTTDLYRVSLLNRAANRILKPIAPTPDYWGVGKLNERVIANAREFRPDFIVFFKPVYVRPRTLRRLNEELPASLFSWYPDDAFYTSNASRFFYESIPIYDCHFTTKSFNVLEFLHNGAQKAVFLPPAVASQVFYPIEPSPDERRRLGADVGFIGTYADDKRVSYLERLVKDGYSVKIFGNDWQKISRSSPLRACGALQFRPLYGEEHCKALRSFKIASAFLRAHNRDVQTIRTYEIPACAAFMLHERTDEAMEVFKEGEEAEYFEQYGEFREKIDFYLARADLREKIARSGFERAKRPDVSYESRANGMISQFRNLQSAKATSKKERAG